MKKVFSILMVAMFALSMAACGDKNDNTNNENGNGNGNQQGDNTNTVLHLTDWRYGTDNLEATDPNYLVVRVTFRNDNCSIRTITSTDIADYDGPYTYTGTLTDGNGTMTLQDTQAEEPVGTASFSISGTTMTLQMHTTTDNHEYTLEKESFLK